MYKRQVPALVRPKPEGGYEMVAGHRRKKAADLAGLAEIPCIVRQLTDDEATIIMVDSNLPVSYTHLGCARKLECIR